MLQSIQQSCLSSLSSIKKILFFFIFTSNIEPYHEVSPFHSARYVPTSNSCNYLKRITATSSHRYLQKFSTIHTRCILCLRVKDTVKLYLKFHKSNKNELLLRLHPCRNSGGEIVSHATHSDIMLHLEWLRSRVSRSQEMPDFSISETKIWKY